MEKNKNLENTIENKFILSELKKEVEKNFGINEKEIQNIIKKQSLESIEKLKLELQNKNRFFGQEEIKNLFEKLNQIKVLIENDSKNEIYNLRKEVEEKINIDNFENSVEKYLPRKLLKVAKNPQKPHEHLIGATLGMANSTIAIGESFVKIGVGIIKSPYDLYLLASGKAELENTKKI